MADDVALRGGVPRRPRERASSPASTSPLDGGSSAAARPGARVSGHGRRTASRSARSARSTGRSSEDLAFYAEHGITNVGISLVKLERHGWDDGAARVRDAGLRVDEPDRARSVPPLADREQWDQQRERLVHALDAGVTVGAECLVVHHRSRGPADLGGGRRRARGGARAGAREAPRPGRSRSRSSTRTRCGSTSASCTRCADVVDLARRLDVGVCMEINACWAERGLGATIAARDGPDPARPGQRLRGRHALDAEPARPRRRRHPARPRSSARCSTRATTGCFDLELIGPAIEAEGYDVGGAARGRPPRRELGHWRLTGLSQASAGPGDRAVVEAAGRRAGRSSPRRRTGPHREPQLGGEVGRPATARAAGTRAGRPRSPGRRRRRASRASTRGSASGRYCQTIEWNTTVVDARAPASPAAPAASPRSLARVMSTGKSGRDVERGAGPVEPVLLVGPDVREQRQRGLGSRRRRSGRGRSRPVTTIVAGVPSGGVASGQRSSKRTADAGSPQPTPSCS